jgi:hypothetical protein
MHTFYSQRYTSLTPAFWHAEKLFNVENKAPFFGHDYLEDLENNEWAFASNLTFTKSDSDHYIQCCLELLHYNQASPHH